eukprot:gene8054-9909_t
MDNYNNNNNNSNHNEDNNQRLINDFQNLYKEVKGHYDYLNKGCNIDYIAKSFPFLQRYLIESFNALQSNLYLNQPGYKSILPRFNNQDINNHNQNHNNNVKIETPNKKQKLDLGEFEYNNNNSNNSSNNKTPKKQCNEDSTSLISPLKKIKVKDEPKDSSTPLSSIPTTTSSSQAKTPFNPVPLPPGLEDGYYKSKSNSFSKTSVVYHTLLPLLTPGSARKFIPLGYYNDNEIDGYPNKQISKPLPTPISATGTFIAPSTTSTTSPTLLSSTEIAQLQKSSTDLSPIKNSPIKRTNTTTIYTPRKFRKQATKEQLKKIERAIAQTSEISVKKEYPVEIDPFPNQKFEIIGTSRDYQIIISTSFQCSCPDFHGKLYCKHIAWIMMYRFGIDSKHYTIYQNGLLEIELYHLLVNPDKSVLKNAKSPDELPSIPH